MSWLVHWRPSALLCLLVSPENGSLAVLPLSSWLLTQCFLPTCPADLGSFADAARAYEAAGDAPAAARVFLQRLHDAKAAADLAARTRSAEAALAVARHCEHGGPALQQLAVEQYCLAGERSAAFALAKRGGLVPAFAAWARQERDGEAAQLAAEHLEAQGQLAAAAELCALAGRPERAARLYLHAGGDGLPAAIKLAQEAGDPAAAAVVLEHLQVWEEGTWLVAGQTADARAWDEAACMA